MSKKMSEVLPPDEILAQLAEECSAVLWPVGGGRQREFMRWPAYEKMYISAFERMLKARKKRNLESEGKKFATDDWKTGMDVFRWWMEDDNISGQLSMDDLMEDNNV